MKWLKKIVDGHGSERDFALKIGIDPARVWYWLNKGVKADSILAVLCKARKLSGMGWVEMGKILDEEYLAKHKDGK